MVKLECEHHTFMAFGFCFGKVSTGLIQATPGDIKSLRSSADKRADDMFEKFECRKLFGGVRIALDTWKVCREFCHIA